MASHRDNYDVYNKTSSVAESAGNMPEVIDKSYNFWREHYAKHLPANLDCNIIELGSGLGNNLLALQKLGYKNVKGLELCQGSVDSSIKQGLDVVQGDIFEYLEANQQTFDLIILHHVLEHFTRAEGMRLLNTIRENLSAKGTLLIAVPNGWNLFACGGLTNDFTHELIYSRTSLTTILSLCGFDAKLFSTALYTCYDSSFCKRLFKTLLLKPFSILVEALIKVVMLSQGLGERDVRPNLVAIATAVPADKTVEK